MPELHWLGDGDARREARRVPYRLLTPVEQVGDPAAQNLLIQGDNLEALKALLPFYAGRVKCIFIDPPYNTKSAFEHYDDNLEHSQWLSMMYPRLELLRDLLSEDGSIWVTIDDNEAHYLKVVMDEVFGRANFVSNIVWQSKDTPGNNASTIAQTHNMVLVFRRSGLWKPYLVPRSERQIANYKNPDHDSRGPWLGTPLTRAEFRERDYYPLTNEAGRQVLPPKGSSWRRPLDEINKLQREKRIYWGKDGNAEFPVEKKFLSEVKGGVVPQSWWPYDFAGSTRNASAEMKGIFLGEKAFDTPKPEKIVQRVLEIATQEGDLVLDSFVGSGTTGAVAQKLGRRYIAIEMGEHAATHCLPRLKKVVEGEQGGVSEAVGWKGGGGFRFMKLGEPVFREDGCINPAVRFDTLASYLWFLETGTPHSTGAFTTPLLGVMGGETNEAGVAKPRTALILLYNGILGDRRPQAGNVLTTPIWNGILAQLAPHDGPRVIYGEACRLSRERLKALKVTFKQIPHEIRMR